MTVIIVTMTYHEYIGPKGDNVAGGGDKIESWVFKITGFDLQTSQYRSYFIQQFPKFVSKANGELVLTGHEDEELLSQSQGNPPMALANKLLNFFALYGGLTSVSSSVSISRKENISHFMWTMLLLSNANY